VLGMEKLKIAIDKFLAAAKEKEEQKNKLIADVKRKIEEKEAQITERANLLVEIELKGKKAEVSELEKEIQAMNGELLTLQQKLNSYRLFEVNPDINSEDLKCIRNIALEMEKLRIETITRLRDEKNQLEEQLKQLQVKIAAKGNEISNVGLVEEELVRIKKYIPHDEVKHLPYLNDNGYVFNWLHKEEIEIELAEIEERERIAKTAKVAFPLEVHTIRFQGGNRKASFEMWKAQNPRAKIIETSGFDSSILPAEVRYTL